MTAACALLLLMAIAADSPGAGPATEESQDGGRLDCGTAALYHLLQLEGRPIELESLRAALGPSGPDGRSFRELRSASRRFGLSLDAVLLPKVRSSLSGPTLALLKNGPEGHFVVVRPVGQKGLLVQVLDGEQAPYVIDAQRLLNSSVWTGLILIPHRTNYLLLGALGATTCCATLLGFRLWSRRRSRARLGVGIT